MSDGSLSIVLVDDDDMLRTALAANLARIGFSVHSFADPAEAFQALTQDKRAVDLLILDWRMPGMTGLELLQKLRADGIETPALFFTSMNAPIFEEAALSASAVDFIDKTRSFSILEKRIALIMGRKTPAPHADTAPLYQAGPLTLEPACHRIHWHGNKVDLTFGEFRVVQFLVQSDRDVSYREIYDIVRGENFVAGDGTEGYRVNVRALIKRIREKFLAEDPGFSAIVNFPGFGYRWAGASDA